LTAEVINELLTLLQTFTDRKFMTEYRRRCFILGKDIRIYSFGDEKGIRARAIDIDRDGGLVVEYMEGPSMREIKTITTGEVSVRSE
ncbi:MAG TPA: biotin--[acetyl-CoA-carboxylase] ligase, partial [Candidatus Avanaerovorax faecigallinarum]|nr:biotin--[acetyl-CoA-carboxylase] ligase [Candidatus Avanaerovorax faecigallinarum]